MENNQDFELFLNALTAHEMISQPEPLFKKQYEPFVIHMLAAERKYHLFVEDFQKLREYEGMAIQEILESRPNIVSGGGSRWPNPYQGGKYCEIYYDIAMDLFIEPRHKFHDLFFAYMLKQTDLHNIDHCLAYQLEKYYSNNLQLFSRFLQLTIRKYKGKIFAEETALTVQEWITVKEQQLKEATLSELNGKDRFNGKAKIRRRPNDNETVLSQPQTVLLIHYMQRKAIFLNNEFLTDADAGKAFEVLTGYSQHTIRQDLGQYRDFQNKENLKKVQQVLTGITTLIDNQLSGKVPFQ